jgi:hypothetical protein
MITRRHVLGLAAIAPVTALGPEAAHGVPGVLGPPPSGGDDLAALRGAMPQIGPLLLPPGSYALSGPLEIGDGQDIIGSGGNLLGAATVLRCTTPEAGLTVTGSAGVSGNLLVDGDGVAVTPFSRLLGTLGAQRTFLNLSVARSARDNMIVLGAQNDLWLGCNSQAAARDDLVLDQGAGGHAFVRCEFDAAGRYHLRSDAESGEGPYAVPTDNTFDHCLFERGPSGGAPVSNVYLGAHDLFHFTACTFQAPATATGPRIDVAGPGSLIISAGRLIGDDARSGGTGLRVTGGARVVLCNQPEFVNLALGMEIVSGQPPVDVIGSIFWNNVGSRFNGGDEAASSVSSRFRHPVRLIVPHRERTALSVHVEDEVGARLVVGGDGSVGFSDGRSSTPQAWLLAGGDGVLSMPDGQVLQTGRGPSASRPAADRARPGSMFYDITLGKPIWSDGAVWRDATGAEI